MEKYKYKKKAGALQEAYDLPENAPTTSPAPPMKMRMPVQSMANVERPSFDREASEQSADLDIMRESVRAQSMPRSRSAAPQEAPRPGSDGLDLHWKNYGGRSMLFYTVEEGKRVMMVDKSGTTTVIDGPAKVWRWGRSFRPMKRFVAHPSEFLIVRFRNGEQQHKPGPAYVWLDTREHQDITKEDALPIADKEAVIVYAEDDEGEVKRRIVHGPATFVPKPGEWLHTFSWHGNVGGRKVPGALEFQKLWLLPDQMYHDVPDVRTADDAVLTIRLMLFFELSDIETMLATTHDPIGDFLNAATADVVDFVGRHSFESFKKNTEQLNDSATYKQLGGRADSIGYKINRVVYRGYGAKATLEQLHDQAIESRTRLQLEKATEEQAQELEDLKLEREINRAHKQRSDQAEEAQAKLERERLRAAALQAQEQDRRKMIRGEQKLDAEQRDSIERLRATREQEHLAALEQMNVDLTRYLTQNRADQIIELRGEGAPSAHVHLPKESNS